MSATPGLWTEERRELLNALNRVDDTLGAMYESAIELLGRSPRTVASLSLAAHCIREITNVLPDVLRDVDGVPRRSNVSSPSQELAACWETNGVEAPTVLVDRRANEPAQVTTLPIEVVSAAHAVVVAVTTGQINSRLRLSALVLGRLDNGDDVTVKVMAKSVKYFMKYIHLSRPVGQPLPAEADVLHHLRVVEKALLARVGRFFATAEKLLAAVELANRREAH